MATEDVLPKELDKLEITHTLPQIKLLDSNLPVQLNPFFENDLKDTGPVNKLEQTTSTKTNPSPLIRDRSAIQNCRRCRYRRVSECSFDELKYAAPNILSDSLGSTRTLPSGVIKLTMKKGIYSSAGSSGNRKVLIREPVLKALQTCLHPHSNVRRKLLATATTKPNTSDGPMATKGMSDFRDLIDECRNLLSEDVDFSGRLNQLCLSNRNSKNFTTMQTPKMQSNKPSNGNVILSTATLSVPSPETTTINADHHDAHSMSLLQPPLLASNTSSTNLQHRNTTCSQQAGNSAASVCDDVTIDELASYFDTFVHIPKKMSSMAEMMYI